MAPVKILFLEDNDEDFELLRGYLRNGADARAFELHQARHQEEAIELCRGEDYYLVILDYHLGYMETDVSGIQVARQLMGLPSPPRVIMTSDNPGLAEDPDVDFLLQNNIPFLPKTEFLETRVWSFIRKIAPV